MKRRFTDQMGRDIIIPYPPQRIISLVPSQTELLYYFDLAEQIVGITKFCVHPSSRTKHTQKVGGTKKLHPDRIAGLEPDLIIGNKEENDREQIEALAQEYPIWMSDIKTLDDAIDMIRQIGIITNKSLKSRRLARELQESFEELALLNADRPTKTAAYLIWNRPLMAAGRDTFVDEMLRFAGFSNIFADQSRYPEILETALIDKKPAVILLPSEPFPFKSTHVTFFRQLCPQAVVQLVDGELFSWYGNRLLKSIRYFRELYDTVNTAH